MSNERITIEFTKEEIGALWLFLHGALLHNFAEGFGKQITLYDVRLILWIYTMISDARMKTLDEKEIANE